MVSKRKVPPRNNTEGRINRRKEGTTEAPQRSEARGRSTERGSVFVRWGNRTQRERQERRWGVRSHGVRAAGGKSLVSGLNT